MYLSRLVINPRNPDARRDLDDLYSMHRRVMSAFPQVDGPGDARTQLAVLHRLDVDQRNGATVLLVQSGVKPDWNSLPPGYLALPGTPGDNPATKSITQTLTTLSQGQILRFRLRANPTKKIDSKSGPDGRRRNGRRVDLRTEMQQIDWLCRRGEQGGFRLLPVQPGSIVPAVRTSIAEKHRTNGRSGILTIAAVLFEGALQICDADEFRRTISEGVGPSKSFGCGLLSIAPYRAET